MRVVLDTNVLIAAFVARGTCHDLLERCERDHDIISSEFILSEYAEKLLGKFRVPRVKVSRAVALMRSHTQVVEPIRLSEPICRDPDDDWVLATAVSGGCDCLITGDRDLLSLRTHAGIPILSPGMFWAFENERIRSA